MTAIAPMNACTITKIKARREKSWRSLRFFRYSQKATNTASDNSPAAPLTARCEYSISEAIVWAGTNLP